MPCIETSNEYNVRIRSTHEYRQDGRRVPMKSMRPWSAHERRPCDYDFPFDDNTVRSTVNAAFASPKWICN